MSLLKTAVWNVRFTLPKGDPKGERGWAKNATISCVCDSIDAAIRLVREEHPDAQIFAVNHKGHEMTLFDASIAQPVLVAATSSGGTEP